MSSLPSTLCDSSGGAQLSIGTIQPRQRFIWYTNGPWIQGYQSAQYADDIILLGGAIPNIARRFKSELDSYCKVSGHKINLRKIHIYSWNINPREMYDISRILGITGVTNWDSLKYLGVPNFKASPKATDWRYLVEKIKKENSLLGSNLALLGREIDIY